MKCPKCDGNIEDKGNIFACSNEKQEKNEETKEWEDIGTCSFRVWKSAFSRFGGVELTEDILEKIIVEGECEVDLVGGKSGKPYTAFAIPDEKYGVKIDFDRFNK